VACVFAVVFGWRYGTGHASRASSFAHDYHHILKSLVYFADAQSDPMPDMRFKVSWREVTTFFKKEIPRLAVEIVGLR